MKVRARGKKRDAASRVKRLLGHRPGKNRIALKIARFHDFLLVTRLTYRYNRCRHGAEDVGSSRNIAVIACASFKGTLSSRQAGDAIARGMRRAGIDAVVVALADGGEGLVEALVSQVPAMRDSYRESTFCWMRLDLMDGSTMQTSSSRVKGVSMGKH
ncbi:MAG: glycerate kinase [Polyangiaceae bacterium]|nr:glycerate kinase [Polyangiaceae bacterium]